MTQSSAQIGRLQPCRTSVGFMGEQQHTWEALLQFGSAKRGEKDGQEETQHLHQLVRSTQ
jgi:hypothetical protein